MADVAKTRNEAAHTALRADIVAGHWRSGERLAFAGLCAKYSVSVGVIREALARLVEQGFVESRPQQGFFVVTTSAEDLLEIAEIRAEIESYAIGKAVAEGGLEWAADVMAAHFRLEGTPITADGGDVFSPAWISAHVQFHVAVHNGIRNQRLRTMIRNLAEMTALYATWRPAAKPDIVDALVEDHRVLIQAIRDHDPEGASRLTRDHIRRQAQYSVAHMSNREETSAESA